MLSNLELTGSWTKTGGQNPTDFILYDNEKARADRIIIFSSAEQRRQSPSDLQHLVHGRYVLNCSKTLHHKSLIESKTQAMPDCDGIVNLVEYFDATCVGIGSKSTIRLDSHRGFPDDHAIVPPPCC